MARNTSSFTFANKSQNSTHGTFKLLEAKKEVCYTMLDYLRGGMQMSLMVGIDFTASNGSPNNKSSLHYFDPNSKDTLNLYQQSILSIGEILLNYDSDKLVSPVLNKGACLRFWGRFELPEVQERRP